MTFVAKYFLNKDEVEDEVIFYKKDKYNMCLYKNLKDYLDIENLYTMFKNAWNENPSLAIKILLHTRDYKNGRGEKRISHLILYFIRKYIPEIYENVLLSFIQIGYWKDVLYICEILKENNENMNIEVELFAKQLLLDNSSEFPTMCAKWAPSENSKYDYVAQKIIKKMNMTPREYRKMLSHSRKIISEKSEIVERNMSQQNYDIDFENVPFKALILYKNSFKRTTNSKGIKTSERKQLNAKYVEYVKKLKTDRYKNMYEFKNNFKNCACVVDVSDSMKRKVKYSTLPIDISIFMGILIHESDPNNKIFSYSDTIRQVYLKSVDIKSKIEEIKKIEWNNNMNYNTFVNHIKNDNFQKIFILTDMNINEEDSLKLSTLNMTRAVYWNLRSYKNEIKIETIGNLTKITGFTNYLMNIILNTDQLTDNSIFYNITDNYSTNVQSII